jgi:hypothetical protein
MIKPLPSMDDETPIEEFPGFISLDWDEPDLSTDMPELFDFWNDVWSPYAQTVADEYLERTLLVNLPKGSASIHIDANSKLAPVLAQLPVFDVYFDSGPEDAGPASGSGYVICLADGASTYDVKLTFAALADSIRSDEKAIQNLIGG